MGKKGAPSIFLFFLIFIASVAMTGIASTQETTAWIAVDPSSYEAELSDFIDLLNTTYPYDGRFTININISANDLYVFAYSFTWNSTLLNVTQISIVPLWSNYSIGENKTIGLGDGRSKHDLLVYGQSPSPPFNETATICTYTFLVKHQPYYPEPSGHSTLDLEDTLLLDSGEQSIVHNVYDGEYEIKQERVPIISTSPINWTLGVNSSCIVDVMIINVTSNPEYYELIEGIHAFDFKLLYNTACLHAINVTLPPGHFLEPIDLNKIFVVKTDIDEDYNATHGQIWVAATLLDPEPPKNGSGILARINFNITSRDCTSPLSFYIAPGYPFPAKLAYRKGSAPKMKAYVVPCTLGLGEAQARPRPPPSLSIPTEYIVTTITILVLVIGPTTYFYRKRRGYRKEDEDYGWLKEENL